MNRALLRTFCLFICACRCQSLSEFLRAIRHPLRDERPHRLNAIIEHCGEEDVYKQLTVMTIGQDLGFEFYRNIHEGFSIPLQVFDAVDNLDSVGGRSCVILCLSIERISDFLGRLDEHSWMSTNMYVIHTPDESPMDEKTVVSYERVWSSAAAELWRKKYVQKLILSINGRNLFFDPFERSRKSGDEGKRNSNASEVPENSFGVAKDLGNSAELLRRKDTFDGYETGVALFPYITVKKDNHRTWSGPDVNVMHEICKRLNVTPRIFDTPEQFGWFWKGKFVGALGRLVDHDSDFAFNAFFVKNYGSEDLEFSTYINTDKICVIVPKQPRLPEYLLIARIFSLPSWALILVGNSFVALTYVGMTSVDSEVQGVKKLRKSFGKFPARYVGWRRNLTRVQCFLATWIFFSSYPVKTDVKNLGERLHVACGLMLGIVIGGCFTSQLASSFSRPAFLRNIDTLAELDDSGLEVLTSFPNLLNDVFADNETSTFRNLNEKLTLKNASEIDDRVLRIRNAGYLDRLHSLLLGENPTDELHVVSEYPHEYPLAYPIAKGSPFLPMMNKIIGRLHNGGLYMKWFSDMRKPVKNDESQNPVVIRLPHLYIPFIILLVGLGISGGIFCCELSGFVRKQGEEEVEEEEEEGEEEEERYY